MWDEDEAGEGPARNERSPDPIGLFAWGFLLAGFGQLGMEYGLNLLPSGLYFVLVPIGAVLLGVRCWRRTRRVFLTLAWASLPLLVLGAFFAIVA